MRKQVAAASARFEGWRTHQSIAFISSLAMAAPMHMCGPWMKTCPRQLRCMECSATDLVRVHGLAGLVLLLGIVGDVEPACERQPGRPDDDDARSGLNSRPSSPHSSSRVFMTRLAM